MLRILPVMTRVLPKSAVEPAERSGEPAPEQEGEEGADRVERDDAEADAAHRHAEDGADRLEQDVEAGRL